MLHTLRPDQEDACIYCLVWGRGKVVTFKAMRYVCSILHDELLPNLAAVSEELQELSLNLWRIRTFWKVWEQVTLNLSPRDLFSNSHYDLSPRRSTFLLLRVNKTREWNGSPGTALPSGRSCVVYYVHWSNTYWAPTKWWPWEYHVDMLSGKEAPKVLRWDVGTAEWWDRRGQLCRLSQAAPVGWIQ